MDAGFSDGRCTPASDPGYSSENVSHDFSEVSLTKGKDSMLVTSPPLSVPWGSVDKMEAKNVETDGSDGAAMFVVGTGEGESELLRT